MDVAVTTLYWDANPRFEKKPSLNEAKARRRVAAAKIGVRHGSKSPTKRRAMRGVLFSPCRSAVLSRFAGGAFLCRVEGLTPLFGNAGGVGPSSASRIARLRLRRTLSTPRRRGLAFLESGPTAPGRAFLASLRNAAHNVNPKQSYFGRVWRFFVFSQNDVLSVSPCLRGEYLLRSGNGGD